MSLLLSLLLITPTYGESPSDQVETLRHQMKQMILQKEVEMKLKFAEEKEVMKIKFKEMQNHRDEEMKEIRNKFEEEREEKSDLTEKLNVMTKKLDTLQNSPVVISCAYKYYWSKAGSVITYDYHVVEDGGKGGINLDDGTFTVGPGGDGYYTVTYSGTAVLNSGELVYVFLYRNGEDVGGHGHWYSHNGNSATVHDQGSRTVILYLKEGDYIQLRTAGDNFTGELYALTFCASHQYILKDPSPGGGGSPPAQD